ncbi:SurA N-terminal domain-containing protein [Gammaproteobacteria bacterium]|nr:SurA N-terminal domain-containing protein [Gammaproteobacteria bacterium]
MLQELRNQTQSIGFKVLAGAIIVVLTLFGFGATNIFMGTGPNVAVVGDYEITESVLERETERERRKLLFQVGEDFDPNSIDRLKLRNYALEQLIAKEVLFQTAENLNIKASQTFVDQRLLENPAYQQAGQFDEPTYRQQLQMLGYTPVEFVEEYGRSISAELLRMSLTDSSFVSDWEVGQAIKVLAQRRDIAFLPLTKDKFREEILVSETEISDRYAEEQDLHMTPVMYDLEYLALSAEDLMDSPSIMISEQDIVDAWKEGLELALANAQRESSHILIAVDGDRSETEARDLASSVYDQLKAGDDFEALVTEFSDDAGSVGAGGSLGPAGKGVFAPEFESMLWSMKEEGAVSEPVKTDFGYHLIRLDRVQGVEYPDLTESRDDLVASLRLDAARELFQEKSLDLERFSYDERYGLADTAEQLGVSVLKAENISRSDQGSHAVWLSNIEVLDSVFGDEVPLGENGPLIEVGDERALVVRAYDRRDPDLIPLEKISGLIKESLISEKTDIAIAEAQQTAMDRLQEGASVSVVADEFGLRWSSHEMVRRTTDQEIPQEVLSLAFQLPRPEDREKSVGDVVISDGRAIVTVTRVLDGDLKTLSDEEVSNIREGLENRNGRVSLNSFFVAAQNDVVVERN